MVIGQLAYRGALWAAKKYGARTAAGAALRYAAPGATLGFLAGMSRKRKGGSGGGGGGSSTQEGTNKKRKMNKPSGKRKASRKKSKKKYKQKESKTINASGFEGYGTYSSLTYKKPKMAKTLTWSKQPITYEQLASWAVASSSSFDQGKSQISGINSDPGTGICGSAQLIELYERHAKMRNNTGPAWISLDGDNANLAYNSIYLQKVSIQYTMTNQAPTSVDAELFIVQRKISLRTHVVNLALNDWSNGLTKAQADGSVNVSNFLYNDPTSSKQFNLNWSIVKRIRVKLEPGQEAKHTHVFNVRRLIDMSHASNYAGGIKGIAHESFIVAKGPVTDSSNTFAAGSISTARVKIVGVQKITYQAYAVQNYPRIVYQATANVSTGNAALYSIADAAGTVINTETATNYA